MKVSEIQNAQLGLVRLAGMGNKAWRLTITDTDTREVVWVDLTEEVAGKIIEKLTSGIQIARAL